MSGSDDWEIPIIPYAVTCIELYREMPNCTYNLVDTTTTLRQPLMKFEWDRRKAASNLRKHGISFELVKRLDWNSVVEILDIRHFEETRIIAWGLICERLHVLVYTMRGDICRVISLRKGEQQGNESL